MTTIKILPHFEFLLKEKAIYKIIYGGRGGGKSENIARALLVLALNPQKLFGKKAITILCARQYNTAIKNTVHRAFSILIDEYNLYHFFKITNNSIKSINGSEFFFVGLERNIANIKSIPKIDICWIEEAEVINDASWTMLYPTVLRNGEQTNKNATNSEIWISFNPRYKDDPMYLLSQNPLPNSIVKKVNYYDNPHMRNTPLQGAIDNMKATDYARYLHVYEGEVLKISDAIIFKDKFIVQEFNFTSDHYYFGADWGFSKDPTAIVRCFVKDNNLYIDYEAGGVGIEYEELASLFLSIPESNKWNIYGDSQQPATISYLQKKGFKIYPCKKRAGSVEDGITLLKSFNKIIIHPRCREIATEFATYSYKTDINGNPLPIILDAYNHYIDALRYSLDGYHQRIFKLIYA